MTQPVSDGKIKQVLESPEARARLEDPATSERIKADFEGAAAKVKGRLGDVWDDVQDLYHMATDGGFSMGTNYKVAVIGALVYLVSPLDLVPDVIPVLGVADDVAVLAYAVKYARPEIERYRAYKAGKGTGGASS